MVKTQLAVQFQRLFSNRADEGVDGLRGGGDCSRGDKADLLLKRSLLTPKGQPVTE